MYLFNREYELQIGDATTGKAITINDLQVQFRIKKSANNATKADEAEIHIFNLAKEHRAALHTPNAVCVLSVGYGGAIARLFVGNISAVKTDRQGSDRITKFKVSNSFVEGSQALMSKIIPANATVGDAIESVRKHMGLAKGTYTGVGIKTKIVYGYPLTGTPKQLLDEISDVYGIEWKIENGVLFINDGNTVSTPSQDQAVVISELTGLLEQPYFYKGKEGKNTTVEGIEFTALLNPQVSPGQLVKVSFQGVSDFYKVDKVFYKGDYRGKDWNMKCICISGVS